MTEPRDPVPGTHGKGGANRWMRLKYGPKAKRETNTEDNQAPARRGAETAREPSARMSRPAAWAFTLGAVVGAPLLVLALAIVLAMLGLRLG